MSIWLNRWTILWRSEKRKGKRQKIPSNLKWVRKNKSVVSCVLYLILIRIDVKTQSLNRIYGILRIKQYPLILITVRIDSVYFNRFLFQTGSKAKIAEVASKNAQVQTDPFSGIRVRLEMFFMIFSVRNIFKSSDSVFILLNEQWNKCPVYAEVNDVIITM